jgi:hypothetical protein
MDIEKLFGYLSNNKKLILYLFEHQDRVIYLQEVEDLVHTSVENLAFYEIVEVVDDKISLDLRVVAFLEEYIQRSEVVDIAMVGSILEELEHTIQKAQEFPKKLHTFIPKIRRYILRIDNVLFRNLEKLRDHINRVYKNTDEFKLKLKELNFYKTKLDELQHSLNSFEKFLESYTPLMKHFSNDELDSVVMFVKLNKIELFRTLIPLTQDVISYINKLESKNLFIEKIIKLKELKDSYELYTKTNIKDVALGFDIYTQPLKISTRLDTDVVYSPDFEKLLQRQTSKKQLKSNKAPSIEIHKESISQDRVVSVDMLHLQFIATNLSLIEFLASLNELRDKSIVELSQIYCKMLLMYDDEYKITTQTTTIEDINFAKVYHK